MMFQYDTVYRAGQIACQDADHTLQGLKRSMGFSIRKTLHMEMLNDLVSAVSSQAESSMYK